jgi:hypothetical protein
VWLDSEDVVSFSSCVSVELATHGVSSIHDLCGDHE